MSMYYSERIYIKKMDFEIVKNREKVEILNKLLFRNIPVVLVTEKSSDRVGEASYLARKKFYTCWLLKDQEFNPPL